MFSSPALLCTLFFSNKLGEKMELNKTGGGKRKSLLVFFFFLSEIHEEKISATKFCKASSLIKRLFFIGTDVWNHRPPTPAAVLSSVSLLVHPQVSLW